MTAQQHHFESLFRKKQCENNQNLAQVLISPQKPFKKQGLYYKKPSFKSSSYEEEQSQYSSNSNKNVQKQENKSFWTKDQNFFIISHFKEIGADWVQIAYRLQNKTSLQIKNHFTKLLRVIINNLNNTLRQNNKRQIEFKTIKAAIKSCEDNFGEAEPKGNEAIIRDQLWRLVYNYLVSNQDLYNNNDGRSLEVIHQILQIIKRIHRKKHSSKASTEIYMKQEVQNEHLEQGYISDQSSFLQQASNQWEEHLYKIGKQADFSEEEPKVEQSIEKSNGVIVEESQQRISDLLRQSGVLQVELRNNLDQQIKINQSEPSSISQNLNNEDYQHFYEQGELEGDCYWKISWKSMNNAD